VYWCGVLFRDRAISGFSLLRFAAGGSGGSVRNRTDGLRWNGNNTINLSWWPTSGYMHRAACRLLYTAAITQQLATHPRVSSFGGLVLTRCGDCFPLVTCQNLVPGGSTLGGLGFGQLAGATAPAGWRLTCEPDHEIMGA